MKKESFEFIDYLVLFLTFLTLLISSSIDSYKDEFVGRDCVVVVTEKEAEVRGNYLIKGKNADGETVEFVLFDTLVKDVLENKLIIEEGKTYRFKVKGRTSRIFFSLKNTPGLQNCNRLINFLLTTEFIY